ncbi:tail fiber protein [Caulobacter phage Seuss]|uniref:Tail fiber protein n=1 Tax=Caulobacter phage Seuss TaxID=1675601 RepID=A0A0K1LM66_9CAUD|nr:central tail fiber J [Caulobacter phage Seuss]AKU43554.1 tail fiber protein [Caulobacter phage Seuss]
MSKVLKFGKSSSSSKSPVRTPDTMVSTDTVEVLMGISEGPIAGLVDGPKSFYADSTPLLNETGEPNFKNFALDFYPGNETGHTVQLDLGGFSSPLNVGVNLAKDVPVVRSGFVQGIDCVDFRIVVQQLMLSNDKGTYTTELSLKFEVKKKTSSTWSPAWISEGSTTGLDVTDDENVASYRYYNSDPEIASFEGDVQAYTSTTPPVAPPVDPTQVAYSFKPNTAGTDIDGVYRWSTSTQSWSPVTPSPADPRYTLLADGRRVYKVSAEAPADARQGDLWNTLLGLVGASNMRVLVWNGTAWVKPSEYQPQPVATITNGIWTTNAKVSSPTPKDIRVYLQDAGPNDEWEYRVTKLSADSTTEIFSEVAWESVQEITRTPYTFVGLAMARVIGRASDQFSSIPVWSSLCKGRIVKVPSNYDPVTRIYTGVWDGTYKLAYTNNTAFIFQDFVENTRYGLSSVFPHVVNKWKIYQWGQHCDVQVQKLDGTYQPRWTYNEWIQTPRDAKEMAQYIAGSAGALYVDDGNGIVDVIIDVDAPAVAIFGIENTNEDGFKYSYTDRLTRPNEYTVNFINPDLNWQQDSRIVRDEDDIALFGRIPEDFVATGCTNVDEALRRARRRLIGGLTEKEIVTFTTNRKGRFLSSWDVILVADEKMARGISGRIKAVTGARQVSLRDPVSFEAGIEYWATFDIVNPAYPATSTSPYVTVRRKITNAAGAGYLVLNFDTDLPTLPPKAQFVIEAAGILGFPKAYRITNIEDDAGTGDYIKITALEFNRNKYFYIDTGTGTIEQPGSNEYIVLPPENLKVTPNVKTIGLITTRVLTVSWDASPSKWVRAYHLYHSVNGEPAKKYEVTNALSFDLEGVIPGSQVITLVAVDIRGRESKPVSIGYNTEGETRWVPGPTNLRLVGGVNTLNFDTPDAAFAWDGPAEVDPYFSTYRTEIVRLTTGFPVRVTDVGTALTWSYLYGDMVKDVTPGQSPPRSFKINVYAVDQFGNQSAPVSLTPSNPAPAAPGISAVGIAGGLEVYLTPNTERDLTGMLIWVSTSAGFNPLTTTPVLDTSVQRSFFYPAPEVQQLFVRVAYYDGFGKDPSQLNISAEATATPAPLADIGQEVLDQLQDAIDIGNAAAVNAQKAIDDADELAQRVIRDAIEGLEARARFLLLTHIGNTPAKTAIAEEIVQRETDTLAMVQKTDTIIANFNTNVAAVEQQFTAVSTALTSEASARLTLATTVGNNKAAADQSIQTLTTNLGAEVTARTVLGTQVGNNYTEYLNQVQLLQDADSATVTTLSLLGARNGTSTAFIINSSTAQLTSSGQSIGNTLSGITNSVGTVDGRVTTEISNRISQDSALSTRIDQVQNTVGSHTTSINTLTSVSDGLNAKYSVAIQTDSGGTKRVWGFELNSNGTTGSFGVLADRFSVSNYAGSVVQTPFTIVGSTVKMSNVEVDTIKTNTIVATHIVSDEITSTVATSSSYGGAIGNYGGGAQVCSISVYCTGKKLLVNGMYSASLSSGPGNINATGNLYRDGTVLVDAGAYALTNYRYSLHFSTVDDPGAGWWTYSLYDTVGPGAQIRWYNYSLSATELKR